MTEKRPSKVTVRMEYPDGSWSETEVPVGDERLRQVIADLAADDERLRQVITDLAAIPAAIRDEVPDDRAWRNEVLLEVDMRVAAVIDAGGGS